MKELISTLAPMLKYVFLGNTVGAYLASMLMFVTVMVICKIFNGIVLKTMRRWAEGTKTDIDDLIVGYILPPLYYIFLLLGLYFAKSYLKIPEALDIWLTRLILAAGIVVGFIYVFRFLEQLIQRAGERYIRRLELHAPPDLEAQKQTVHRVVKQAREVGLTIFIIMAVLTLLANMGVDLKAIWASLGIGGIAVVVAVKDPLTNVVGRIYIFGTGIFDEGHFIVFKNWAGTVKKVGFFRTYLELFTDMTTVSIPNAQFINEGVKNYYGRTKFMYKWDLDVPYEISAEEVEGLIAALKEMIIGLPEVNLDMCWIYLDRLDKYSKVVRVWFQVTLPDWATSLFYGSKVLKRVQGVFVSQGVDFAFPTSSVHLEGLSDSPELRALIPDIGKDGPPA